MTHHSRSRRLAVTVLVLVIAGCSAGGDVREPIPVAFIAAPKPALRLVVVLPGRGDDLASLQRKDMADTIQTTWPAADVILTGLTMPFYRQGQAAKRLHDEIIAPARGNGHREIWLLGISLGGMGAVLYEREYPGQIDGMLLLSPYLGEKTIQDEVRNAGGLGNWNPGPLQPIGAGTFQRELWRTLKDLSAKPQRARAFWLAYGADEPFRAPIELMSPILPEGQVLMLPGRHDWSLWSPAASVLLERARRTLEPTRPESMPGRPADGT